jgi:hypothetical protein
MGKEFLIIIIAKKSLSLQRDPFASDLVMSNKCSAFYSDTS